MISKQNRYAEARGGLKPALTMLAEGVEFMPAWAIALLSLHSRGKEITNETVLSETELWVRFCELQQVDFSGIPFDHEEPVQTIAIVPPEFVIKRHVPAGEVLINTKSALAQMQLHYGVESVKNLTEMSCLLSANTNIESKDGTQENADADIQADKKQPHERELVHWLRETWVKVGRPGGVVFFRILKQYVNQKGSPIVEHYSAGYKAGITWKTSEGTTGEMKKKTIQNKVSTFKRTP